MNDLRVVVTACGAPGAPGIIRALREVTERRIHLIGVDAGERAAGYFLTDEAYVVPEAGSADYLPAMVEISRRLDVDVILPLSGAELLPLSRAAAALAPTRVAVSHPAALEIALDKRRTYEFLAASRVPIPRYHVVRTHAEFVRAVELLGYPDVDVCFKPSVSKGQRGFRIISANADVKRLLFESKPDSTLTTLDQVSSILMSGLPRELLVCEFLPGVEYSVDSLAAGGESLVVIPRTRAQTKMGISSAGVVEKNDDVIRIAEEINRQFAFDYCINVQVRYGSDGVPKLLEINPRVSGTICLSVAAGPNLPYLAVQQSLGERLEIPDINWGVSMVRYWSEAYADAGLVIPRVSGLGRLQPVQPGHSTSST